MDPKVKFRCPGKTNEAGKHVPCGYILNDLIEKIPEDGEDHLVPCPACGRRARIMRTPAEVAKP